MKSSGTGQAFLAVTRVRQQPGFYGKGDRPGGMTRLLRGRSSLEGSLFQAGPVQHVRVHLSMLHEPLCLRVGWAGYPRGSQLGADVAAGKNSGRVIAIPIALVIVTAILLATGVIRLF